MEADNNEVVEKELNCFVIMPISDHPDYPPGHFKRVYDEIIRPAVKDAGFHCERAGDSTNTKVIILSILKAITEYDMAICDLSSLNPNVMYELGIRQMAKMPVTLIKDIETRRIFDTGLMSDIEYDSSLRVDLVRDAQEKIKNSLISTYDQRNAPNNSLLDLLGTQLKLQENSLEVSKAEKLIIDGLDLIKQQLSAYSPSKRAGLLSAPQIIDINRNEVKKGTILYRPQVRSESGVTIVNDIYYFVQNIGFGSRSGVGLVLLHLYDLANKIVEIHEVSPNFTEYLVVSSDDLLKRSPGQFENLKIASRPIQNLTYQP